MDSYKLTEQQEVVIDTIMKVPQVPYVQAIACAGAAKTTTVKEAIRRLLERNPDTKIKVLVYGKSNADEIEATLPEEVDVSTVHSMAYQYTIGDLRPNLKKTLKTPLRKHIQAGDIPKSLNIDFDNLKSILELAELFLVSKYISVRELVVSDDELEYSEQTIVDCLILLNTMAVGKICVTHSFYLKLFHIKVLNGTIKIKPVDEIGRAHV